MSLIVCMCKLDCNKPNVLVIEAHDNHFYNHVARDAFKSIK